MQWVRVESGARGAEEEASTGARDSRHAGGGEGRHTTGRYEPTQTHTADTADTASDSSSPPPSQTPVAAHMTAVVRVKSGGVEEVGGE